MINRTKIIFIFITISLVSLCRSQGISVRLDSIHQLSGSDYKKLSLYYQQLDHLKSNTNYTQLGYDAHQLAKWIHKEQKWEEAIKIIKIAYDSRKKATPFDSKLLKKSCYNYAIYNKRYNNYSIAIEYFEKLLTIDNNNYLKGRAYKVIGECYEDLGDYYKAVEYQLRATDYYNENEIKKGHLIYNHINIAQTYRYIRSAKSAKKAIEHLKKADSLLQKQNNPDKYTSYIINNVLGNLYYEGVATQNLKLCIQSYTNALTLLKEINNVDKIPLVLTNLGFAHIKIDSTVSQNFFNQALQHSHYLPTLKYKIYFGMGIKDLYYKNYWRAQNQFRNTFASYFNKEIPSIYWLPNKEDLDRVTEKADFLEVLKRKLKTWLAIGIQENNPSYLSEAIKTAYVCDQLVDQLMTENLSKSSKLLWRSLASEIYILSLEACFQLKKHEDAFYFMEKNKALLLLQDITKDKSNIPHNILGKEKKLYDKIIYLKSVYKTFEAKDSIQKKILSVEAKLNKFKDSLATIYPEYFTTYALPKVISLQEIRLQPNEVIIQYNMAERVAEVDPETYGMVLTNQQKLLFKIDSIPTFLDDIESLRKKLNHPFKTSKDILQYKKVAHNLYNTLFPKEIQNELKNKKITIITDHILGFIPFEALVTNVNSGRYLIEDCEINYAYSLSFQKENQSISRNARFDFLGVAPVQFKDDLPTLSKSENEIKIANSYYNGSLLLKDKATIANFKEQVAQYKILHLATHADASDSIAPWIAFRNKKLAHFELNTIENNADLVLLSACNTSIGEVRRGEGVMSLARGFFKSGAKTVIPSLWNTNDKTTTHIISDFYRNLSQGKTKSEALRMAKLNYLKSNSDAEASPYYWAPLILIGDTGVLLPQSNSTLFLYLGLAIFSILVLVIIRRIKLLSYRS